MCSDLFIRKQIHFLSNSCSVYVTCEGKGQESCCCQQMQGTFLAGLAIPGAVCYLAVLVARIWVMDLDLPLFRWGVYLYVGSSIGWMEEGTLQNGPRLSACP